MDNFMDTLAQKYNAQEMIKANSQAEAQEMMHLQEQVEAYEAVLQEMRKLNYKNTELTEKMYSLVDESIEKVRTLQIEASEGGANTELISKQMSDAVSDALSEALGNMDATVAQSLSESITSALSQPTEELKQSSERVGSSIQDMKDAMAGIGESAEVIRTTSEVIRGSADDIILAADDVRQSNKALDETIKSQMESDRVFNDVLKNQLTQVMENSRQVIEALEEMKLAAAEKIELQDESIEAFTEAPEDEAQNDIATLLENCASLKASLEALQYSDEANKAYLAGLQENNTSLLSTMQNMAETLETAKATINQMQEAQGALSQYQSQIATSQANIASAQNEMIETQRNYFENHATQNSGKAQIEELRNAVAEVAAGNEELRNGIRSNKLATDDAKTTLKSSFDSAIYGLKQDNKEIVEFMQRMNTGILAKLEDPDKAIKQQEELDKEEEQRRSIEERFKATEDFMHKESVKVYRNVQAVINEKSDRQSENLAEQIQKISVQVGQVKTISIIAMILAAAGVVIQVLGIFGII